MKALTTQPQLTARDFAEGYLKSIHADMNKLWFMRQNAWTMEWHNVYPVVKLPPYNRHGGRVRDGALDSRRTPTILEL